MDTKELIAKGEIKPDPELGQYFTVNPRIVQDLLEAAGISEEDRVLEIGAGTGIITEALCQKACSVIAFEVDKQFEPFLLSLMRKYKNLEVCFENIRKAKLPTGYNKVVGNIPYHISEVLLWTLRLEPVELMAFVTGLKFAKTLTAEFGDKEFTEVSVIFSSRFDISIEKVYEKVDFYLPAPVRSALIKLVFVEKKSLLSDPPRFILRDIWDHKKGKLKNALVEAFIHYAEDKTGQKTALTKNRARELVGQLEISGEKLEHVVDGANTFEIVGKLQKFDFERIIK